jgi:hypothetical protein
VIARPPVNSLSAIRSVPLESNLDPVVHQALVAQPIAEAGRRHQIHGALFEHPRAHPLSDVLTAAPLDHDRIDAVALEEVRQHQAGRSRTDDRDLGFQASGH